MRRFPLSALCAGTTFALLLVGCQSDHPNPIEPVLSEPVQPSLSFQIAGPTRIDANGRFTWEVFAFGGSGAYQYRWDVTSEAGQKLTTTFTTREVSLLVKGTDGDIVLRVTVTSANQTRVAGLAVQNCIGGCGVRP